jgi:hypothetical protein
MKIDRPTPMDILAEEFSLDFVEEGEFYDFLFERKLAKEDIDKLDYGELEQYYYEWIMEYGY